MNFDRFMTFDHVNAYHGEFDSLSFGYNGDNHFYGSNANVVSDGSFYVPQSFAAVPADRFNPSMDISVNYNEARLKAMVNLNSSSYPSISSFLMTRYAALFQVLAPEHHKFLYDQGAGVSNKSAPAKHEGSMASKRSNVTKGQWSAEEDRLLTSLVEKNRARKWAQIALMVDGRIGKQCKERWANHLRIDIKKDPWSEEEDMILIEALSKIGSKWVEIVKRLPGCTENSIKDNWNATKRMQENIKSLGVVVAAPKAQPTTGNGESDVAAGGACNVAQLFEQLRCDGGTVGGGTRGNAWTWSDSFVSDSFVSCAGDDGFVSCAGDDVVNLKEDIDLVKRLKIAGSCELLSFSRWW